MSPYSSLVSLKIFNSDMLWAFREVAAKCWPSVHLAR